MEVVSQISGPSINSEDPSERKEARRNRIRRRLEEAERKKYKLKGTSIESDKKGTFIDDAIDASQDALRKLYFEGKEQVSNILIARDTIEVERRKAEIEDNELRMKKLKKESAEALEKLDVISKKWEELLETRDPLELHQHMKEQKEQCLNLISQKNEVIKDFQEDLKIADEKYMRNRREMHGELGLLTQRIDEQILVMKKAYRGELEKVEESINKTISEVVEKRTAEWETLYNQREKDEVLNLENKIETVFDFHDNLHQLYTEDDEKQRDTRIQLEKDIQVLEQELEQVKALCFLNSEKLDYNYQILKKREEENVYIKNHQKRRLNKLQDIVNNMKKKFADKKEATVEELHGLMKEIGRCKACVVETERKAEYFSKLNDDKFNQVWDMKDDEAKDMLEKIRIADKIIFEQIIGIPWKPPAILSFDKKEIPSYKAVSIATVPVTKAPGSEYSRRLTKDFKENDTSAEVLEGHQRLLQQILELIADQTGFLVDQKLDGLLESHTDIEKAFVRLDSVFSAIGIHNEADIDALKKAFYPYTFCLACDKKDERGSVDMRIESTHKRTSLKSTFQERSQAPSRSRDTQDKVPTVKYEQDDTDEDDTETEGPEFSEIFTEKGMDTNNWPSLKSVKSKEPEVHVCKCNITHPLIIEKQNVLKGLKDFVTSFHSDKCRLITGIESKINKKRFTVSRLLAKGDIVNYWEKYHELLPPKVDGTWTVVFLALTKYLKLLRERHRINMKAQALRKQNQELKRLLSLYRIDKVQDLRLPSISSVPDTPIDFEEISKISNKLAF